jgi:hypothetical protein
VPAAVVGVPFFDAAERAKAEDDNALERLLGPAQLMGAPPKDGDSEWSFETRASQYRDRADHARSDSRAVERSSAQICHERD